MTESASEPVGTPFQDFVRTRRATIAAAALAILAVWEIAVLVHAKRAAPTDADWRRVVDEIEGEFRPGDLLLFAPGWIDPVGRRWLGQLMTVDDAARMDAARYGRLWEISIREARAPETEGRPLEIEERLGPIRIRRYRGLAANVSWDLRDRAQLFEVGFTPRKCVPMRRLATPGAHDQIDVPAARLDRRLVVDAGLADFRTRKESYGALLVTVAVDGRRVAAHLVGNVDGWTQVADVPTDPGMHRVTIEGWAVGLPFGVPVQLDPCVAAESRSEGLTTYEEKIGR